MIVLTSDLLGMLQSEVHTTSSSIQYQGSRMNRSVTHTSDILTGYKTSIIKDHRYTNAFETDDLQNVAT